MTEKPNRLKTLPANYPKTAAAAAEVADAALVAAVKLPAASKAVAGALTEIMDRGWSC